MKGYRYKEYERNRHKKGIELIRSLKNFPCMDCGKRYPPCVMDFDHRDPRTKRIWSHNSGMTALSTASTKRIKEEAAKCDIVCANCHRVRTQKQAISGMFKRKFCYPNESDKLTEQLSLKFVIMEERP